MNDDVVHIHRKTVEPLKVGNKTYRSAYDWELTEKDLEKAARELGETEEKKKACLRKLKEKLSNEPSITFRQDDFYLLRFLRVRKYDVNKALQNVKSFFENRRKNPLFFSIPPDFKSVQELNFLSMLPYTNEEGNIVLWFNVGRWNHNENTLDEIMQSVTTVVDIVSMNPACQINGIIAIHDCSQVSMKHISEFLWKGRLWTYISLAQNGYPWRIKHVIFFNTNRFMRILYSIFKHVLQKKVRERCVFLGSDMTELHQYVNPALLPKKLNGTLKDEECDSSQHILSNLDYIRYERSFISR